MKNVVFTICAKNYLAQALSLRESVLRNNSIDFVIFLADNRDDLSIPDAVDLDDDWLPGWKSMAFKYDVVEFNTSIKPFCIRKLFAEGYERAMYLDPDIFVLRPLEEIFSKLDSYSIVLTPHRCEMMLDYKGVIDEESCLQVGIYNLGFIAIKNNVIGNKVVQWWCKRLKDKCYNEKEESLFVDQKWMNFIPAFFPQEVFVTHDLGLNVALWNLQEREVLYEDGEYMIRNRNNPTEVYPLTFFHFSGYSPLLPERIDKRDETLTTQTNPEFKALVEDYCACELRNEYERYHKLAYSFNTFSNKEEILPLHRRLYRACLPDMNEGIDPFNVENELYKTFLRKGLISHRQPNPVADTELKSSYMKREQTAQKCLRMFLKLLGVKRYLMLIKTCHRFGLYNNHTFLMAENN